MPRAKRQTRRKVTVKHSHARTLLVIDNEPIRRKALHAYLSAEKSLHRVRDEYETFETRDLPEFHRWEAEVFGSLLTKIRESNAAIAEKQLLLEEIEEEAYWSDCSRATAYRRVMERANEPELEDEEEDFPNDEPDPPTGETEKLFGESDLPPEFDFDDYDALSAREKAKFRDFYKNMAAMFAAFTGNPAPDLDEVLERERPGGGTPNPSSHHEPNDRKSAENNPLKTLYRQLVRQLHPDANPNHGPRERELWHEVQSAYHDGDLERLEAVAGRVEIGIVGHSHSLPTHRLHRMTLQLRRALRSLRAQVRHAREHIAWNFTAKSKNRRAVEKEHGGKLRRIQRATSTHLSRLTAELDRLAAQANRSSRPRKRWQPDPRIERDNFQPDLF